MRFVFTRSPRGLRSIGSRAIQAFEGGEAGHVGMLVTDADGSRFVIDASSQGGVRVMPEHLWLAGYEVVDTIDVPLPDEAAAAAFLAAQVGKPYDWAAIVGFVGLRDWQNPSRWYCSELGAAAMLAGGLTLADRTARVGVRLLREIAHARSLTRTA